MVLKGIGVSAGVARGTAYVLLPARDLAVARRDLGEEQVPDELARFDTALAKAEQALLALEISLAEQIGRREAEIFGAQALLVRSGRLVDPVRAAVREQRINVEAALLEVLERLTRTFDAVPDPYLRERAADIRDVGARLLELLVEEHHDQAGGVGIPEHAVVVAEELLPSVTARLELAHV